MNEMYESVENVEGWHNFKKADDVSGLIRRRLRGGGFARGCGCGDRPEDAALSPLIRLASPTIDRAADEGDVRVCLNLAICFFGISFLLKFVENRHKRCEKVTRKSEGYRTCK